MIWVELEKTYKQEDARRIMKVIEDRNTRKAAAAESVTKLSKTPAAMDFINFMRNEPKKPWFDIFDNGRLARMTQTLEENEMLIDARKALKQEDLTPVTPVTPSYTQSALGGAA
jgi:hypothetical protein